MKDPLAYAATKVVPVFLSAPRSIESLRALAEGAFLSANHPGVYTRGVVEVPGEIARRVRAAQAATGSAPREN